MEENPNLTCDEAWSRLGLKHNPESMCVPLHRAFFFFFFFLSFAKFVLVPSNETSSMTHHNCVSPVFRRFDSVFNFKERLGQKRPRRWCSKRSGGSGVNKHIRFTETDDDGAEPRCSAALQKVAICLAAYLYTSLSKCQLFMCAQDHC